MKIRSKHCGEYFCPSDECVDLISGGYLSPDTVNICDDCWEMIEHLQDDISEMHSDADMGELVSKNTHSDDRLSPTQFYTKDGFLMAPTAPPVQGHLSIEAFWLSAINKGLSKAVLQTMDLEGDKNQLIEIGKYTLSNKNENILDIGKYLIIWNNENNIWLMSKDIFNTNMKKPSRLYEWEPEYLF